MDNKVTFPKDGVRLDKFYILRNCTNNCTKRGMTGSTAIKTYGYGDPYLTTNAYILELLGTPR